MAGDLIQCRGRLWLSTFALLLVASPSDTQLDRDYMEPQLERHTTEATHQRACADLHSRAFGDESIVPGVCYMTGEESGDFQDSLAFCRGLGADPRWDVADIEEETEIKLLQGYLGNYRTKDYLATYWIGQNDIGHENSWTYLSEAAAACDGAVFLHWAPGQPGGGLRQNCLTYQYDAGGTFDDTQCDDTHKYLCKARLTPANNNWCTTDVTDVATTETHDPCLDARPLAFSNPNVTGVCYASESSRNVSYHETVNFCRGLTGGAWSVVDIENADENLFLEAWNRDNFPKNNGYWVGQNDLESEGHFRYAASGQTTVYLNWDTGRPDGGADQDCLVMLKEQDGRFQNKDCQDGYYSLCKMRLGATAASPTTMVTTPRQTTEGATTEPPIETTTSPTTVVPTLRQTTEGTTTVPPIGTTAASPTTMVTTPRQTTEGATTEPPIETTTSPTTVTPTLRQTTEGTTTVPPIEETAPPTMAKTTLKQTTEGATTQSQSVENHANDLCDVKQGRLKLLASDALCRPADMLVPSYRVKSSLRCAQNCLAREECRGFGFWASEKEDNCHLCRGVLDENELQYKSGSKYYIRASTQG